MTDRPSPREMEILRMVSEGLQDKQIGRALGIGRGTTKNHMLHLRRKLGAVNRAELVTIGFRRGYLSTERPGDAEQ